MQQFLEAAGIALSAIWSNKLRSFLTMLGNIVAVTSIIAVVSLIQGLNASVSGAITSQVGADSFSIGRSGPTRTEEEQLRAAGNPRVTLEDAEAIRNASDRIRLVMATASSSAEAKTRQETLDSLQIQGVTKEYALLPTTLIEAGRVMTAGEFDGKRNVAVIGWDAADRLFGAIDPLEKFISIAGIQFRVVGIHKKKGAIFGQSQDEFAVIPLGAFQRLFGSRQSLRLTVLPSDPSVIRTAMDDATIALRVTRRLRPAEPDNFGVVTSDTFLELYNQVTSGIFAILIGVVSLSLVVGGIVIMNIMLMVVSERTREIGLRKSLGARRRDVLWQILTESITLSTFGGIVGTTLGFLVAFAISRFTPLPAAVEPWSVMLGIGVTAVVGLFFGLYPAMRAASLDPIEALRRE
ncbi:MAG TPA: ABC transporter permease [Vicinamibacterales bacterium]|jgi:putative ABC transport system permease protein|nr:ABC transporter permease [Acidobacteriota bacterium]HQX81592.1 ABC transporter permease [Vicinamibacterales bacterium]